VEQSKIIVFLGAARLEAGPLLFFSKFPYMENCLLWISTIFFDKNQGVSAIIFFPGRFFSQFFDENPGPPPFSKSRPPRRSGPSEKILKNLEQKKK
jgi:hypothetical protein